MADLPKNVHVNFRDTYKFKNIEEVQSELYTNLDKALKEVQAAIYTPDQHTIRSVSPEVDKMLGEIDAISRDLTSLEGFLVDPNNTYISQTGDEVTFEDIDERVYLRFTEGIKTITEKARHVTDLMKVQTSGQQTPRKSFQKDASTVLPLIAQLLDYAGKDWKTVPAASPFAFPKSGTFANGQVEEAAEPVSVPGSVSLSDPQIAAPAHPQQDAYHIAQGVEKKQPRERLASLVVLAQHAKEAQDQLIAIAERNAAQGSEVVEADPEYIAKKQELLDILRDIKRTSYGKSGRNLAIRDLQRLNRDNQLSTLDMYQIALEISQAYGYSTADRDTPGARIVYSDLHQGNQSPERSAFGQFMSLVRRYNSFVASNGPNGAGPQGLGGMGGDDTPVTGQLFDYDENGNINGTEVSGNLLQALERLMEESGITVTYRKETDEEKARREAEERVKKQENLEQLTTFRERVLEARARLADRKTVAGMSQKDFVNDKILTAFHPPEDVENDPGSWQLSKDRYDAFERVSLMRTQGGLRDAFEKWASGNFAGGFSTLFRDDPNLSDTIKGEMGNVIGDANGSAETYIMRLLAAFMGYFRDGWITQEHHDAIVGELEDGNKVAEDAAKLYSDVVAKYGDKNLFTQRTPAQEKRRKTSSTLRRLILEAIADGIRLPYAYVKRSGFADIADNPEFAGYIIHSTKKAFRDNWNHLVVRQYDIDNAPSLIAGFAPPVEEVDTTSPSPGETATIAPQDEEPEMPALFDEELQSAVRHEIKDEENHTIGFADQTSNIRDNPSNWIRRTITEYVARLVHGVKELDENYPDIELRNSETVVGGEKQNLLGKLKSTQEVVDLYINRMDAYIAGIRQQIETKKNEAEEAKKLGIKKQVPPALYDKLRKAYAKRDAFKEALQTYYSKEGLVSGGGILDELNLVDADEAFPGGMSSQYAASFFNRLSLGMDTRIGALEEFHTRNNLQYHLDEKGHETSPPTIDREVFENEGITGINNLLTNPTFAEQRISKIRTLALQTFRDDDTAHPHQLSQVLMAIDEAEDLFNQIAALEQIPPAKVTVRDQQEWNRVVARMREVSGKVSGMFRWGPGLQKHKEELEEPALSPVTETDIAVSAARSTALQEMIAPLSEAKGAQFVGGVVGNAGQTFDDWLTLAGELAKKNNPRVAGDLARQERTGSFITGRAGYLGKSREDEEGYYQEMAGQVTDDDRAVLEQLFIAFEKIRGNLRILGNTKREGEWAVASQSIREVLQSIAGPKGARNTLKDLIANRVTPALEKYEQTQEAEAASIARDASKTPGFASSDEVYAAMIAAFDPSQMTDTTVSLDRFTDLDLYQKLKAGVPVGEETLAETSLPVNQEVIANPVSRLVGMSYALEDRMDYNNDKFDENGDLAGDVDREDYINYLRHVIPGSVSGLADPMEFFEQSRDALYLKRAYVNLQTIGKSLMLTSNYETARAKVAPENQLQFESLASQFINIAKLLEALQASPTTRSVHGLARSGMDVTAIGQLIDSPEKIVALMTQFLTLQNLPGGVAPAVTPSMNSWRVTDFVKGLDIKKVVSGFERQATQAALAGAQSTDQSGWIATQTAKIVGTIAHANMEAAAKGQPLYDREGIIAQFNSRLDEEWRKFQSKNKEKLGGVDRPEASQGVIDDVVAKVMGIASLEEVTGNGIQAELPVTGSFGRSALRGVIDALQGGRLIDYKTSSNGGAWRNEKGELDPALFDLSKGYRSYAFQSDIAQVLLYAAMKGKDVTSAGIKHIYFDKNNQAQSEFINFDETLIEFGKGLLDALFSQDTEGRAQVQAALGNLRPIDQNGTFTDVREAVQVATTAVAQTVAAVATSTPSLTTRVPYAKGFVPPPGGFIGSTGGTGGGGTNIPSAGGNFQNNIFTNNTFMPPTTFGGVGMEGGAPAVAQMPFSKQGAAYAGVTTVLDELKNLFANTITEMKAVNIGHNAAAPFSPEGFSVLASATDASWGPTNARVQDILKSTNAPASALLNNKLGELGSAMITAAPGSDINTKAALLYSQQYLQNIYRSLKNGTYLQLSYSLEDQLKDTQASVETNDFVSAVQAYIVTTLREDRAAHKGTSYITHDVRTGLEDRVNAMLGMVNQAVGAQAGIGTPYVPTPETPLTQEERDRMAEEAVAQYGGEVKNAGRFNSNYLRTMASVREITYAGRGVASGLFGYDSKAATRVNEATNVLQTSLYGASSVSDLLRSLPQMALTSNKDYIAALSLKRQAQVLQQTDIDLVLKDKQRKQEQFDREIAAESLRIQGEGKQPSWKERDENGELVDKYAPSITTLRLRKTESANYYDEKLIESRTKKEQLEAESTVRMSSAQNSVAGISAFFQSAGTVISIFVTVGMALAQVVQLIKKYNEEQNALTRETKKLATEFTALQSGVLSSAQSITTFDQLMTAAKKIDTDWEAKTEEYDDYRKMREAQNLIIFQGAERRIKTTIFDSDQGAKNASDAYKNYEMVAGNTLQAAGQKVFGKDFTVGQNSGSIERAIEKMFTIPFDENQLKTMTPEQIIQLRESGAMDVKGISFSKEFTGEKVATQTIPSGESFRQRYNAGDLEDVLAEQKTLAAYTTTDTGTKQKYTSVSNQQQLMDIARLQLMFRDSAQKNVSPTELIQKDMQAQLLLANITLRDQLANLEEIGGGIAEMNRKAETSAFTGLLFSAQQNAEKHALQTTKDIDQFVGKNRTSLVVDEAFSAFGSTGSIIQANETNKAMAEWELAKATGPSYFRGPGAARKQKQLADNDFTGFVMDYLYTYLQGNGLLGNAEKSVTNNAEIAKKELTRQLKNTIPTAGMFSYNQWKIYDKLAETNPTMAMTSPTTGKPYTYESYTAAVKVEAEKGLKLDLASLTKELAGTKAGTADWYSLVTQINQTQQALADLADAAKLTTTWFNIAGAIVKPTKSIVENNIYPDIKVYVDGVEQPKSATKVEVAPVAAPSALRGGNPIVENFRRRYNSGDLKEP